MALWTFLPTWLLGAFFLLLPGSLVYALPVFHTVNDVDLNGNTCPLIPSVGVQCPILCVPTYATCPDPIRPPLTCPPGQALCMDGQCKDSCPANESNPCDCGTGSSSGLVPCLKGHTVDLSGVIPGQLIPQTASACGLSLSSNITSTWGGPSSSSPSHPGWLGCAEAPEVPLTYKEPFFLALYGWVSAQILLVALWHIYKRFMESRPLHSEALLQDKALPPTGYGQEGMEILGYRRSWPGAIVHRTVNLTSIASVVVLLLIVLDYYGFLVRGTPFGLLHSTNQGAKVFAVCWHFVSLFLVIINLSSRHIDNYFRLRSPLGIAHVVKVESDLEDAIVMDEEEGNHGGIRWLRFVRQYQDKVSHHLGLDKVVENMPIRHTASGQRYFEFRCVRYVFSAGKFAPWSAPVGGTHGELHNQGGGKGLSEASAKELFGLLGPNFIAVRVPGFIKAMKEEFSAFFYLYQMMCLWVWLDFNYYYMAIVQIVVILVSAIVKVILRRRSENKVKSLAEFRASCWVRREGKWSQIDTAYLVPGDVIRIVRGMDVPCDAVLLREDCVVDESNLTGEAMPIRKFSVLPDDPTPYHKEEGTGKAVTLFSGTRILEAKEGTEAIVTHTGPSTDKGALVKQILFPTRVIFTFDEHLKGVIILLLIWGIIAFGLTIWLMGRGDITSWFYGIFIISEIMSPLLPAALVVGQSVAAARLKAQHIQCIHLPRIMLAGKVRTFCFDKTGTLTKEGLDFVGVLQTLPPTPNKEKEENGLPARPIWDDQKDQVDTMSPRMRMGLGGCHGVTQVESQDSGFLEPIGNPVDMEQFRASGFSLVRNPKTQGILDEMTSSDSSITLHVIRRFEFIHSRASMSVALRDPAQDSDRVGIYVKGAFEKIRDMVHPSSLPEDYDRLTDRLASQGYYVLALAYKEAKEHQVRSWDRETMEQDVQFLGLLLFRNSLKPDTTKAIGELKAGDIRPVMITGDHALTGVHIARKCGMVEPGKRVFLGDVAPLDPKGPTPLQAIHWHEVDEEGIMQETPLAQDIEHLTHSDPQVELAVTGKAFTLLTNQGRMRPLLPHTRIFSRMSPDAKVSCVRLHMEKSVTAMCGDGGNDCGALRAAHAGIALSEAEASIVAPFSTPVRSISTCVTLIRQGRAALATSLAGYKFLILYGETMASLELFQYYFSVVVAQYSWILVDSIITVGLSGALTMAQPATSLAPSRPTARLLGPETLWSAVGQIAMNFAFLCGGFGILYRQPWFKCKEFDASSVDTAQWWLLGDSYEAEVIAIICLFQFINAAATFNFGHRYRRAWWRNWTLVLYWGALMTLVSWMTLADPNRVGCFFRLNCGSPSVLTKQLGYPEPTFHIDPYNSPLGHNVLPRSFRWFLWSWCMINALLATLWERLVILGPVRQWFIRRGIEDERSEDEVVRVEAKTSKML